MTGSGRASHACKMVLRTLFLLYLGMMSAQASDGCLAQGDARDIVQTEKLVDLPQATRAARARQPGEIVSANLCRNGGHMVYVLAILTAEGRVVRVSVDARSGRVIRP